jgi:predicted porin
MKKTIKLALPTIIGIAASGSTFAQSSVTLYGILDQSVRYTTNADAANNSSVQMTNGAITNSRWGLKGSESLGGDLKAIFQLENGFEPQTGQMDQNLLFGRYAYVGLESGYGTLKLGRQATEGFNLFGDLDPLTIGNYTANMWPYFLTQGRVSNTVSYAGSAAGFTVGASYGFGGQPGNISADSYWGVRSSYAQGPLMIGAVYQNTRDSAGKSQQMWGAAGRYAIGTATLFLGYIGGIDATGMIDQDYLNDSSRTVTYGSFADNPRKDAIGYTGFTWQINPSVSLTSAFYYDSIRNVNGIGGNSGKRYTGVVEAEYALSKATQVYGTVDYNKVSGGAQTELPGNSNQTGIAVGLRHIF